MWQIATIESVGKEVFYQITKAKITRGVAVYLATITDLTKNICRPDNFFTRSKISVEATRFSVGENTKGVFSLWKFWVDLFYSIAIFLKTTKLFIIAWKIYRIESSWYRLWIFAIFYLRNKWNIWESRCGGCAWCAFPGILYWEMIIYNYLNSC